MAVNLPEVRIPAIEKALRDEVNDLLACPSTVGIAVFGSVARGDYQEGSDIELQVVDSSTPERRTTLTTRYGIVIHKHIQATIDFAERAKVDWRIRPPFSDSWIVLDRDGQLKRLKEFDQRVTSSGRRKLTTEYAERYQRELTAKRQELTRFIYASENMALFCYEAVSRAVDIFYAERRAWYPGSKKVMKDLAVSHPHLHGLVCSALRTDREQVRSTIALLDFVLEILGGSRIGSVGTERPSVSEDATNASVACLSGCRVLLVQRSPRESSFASNWEFPGGRIEPGETPAEAAAREFREECGCEVDIGEQVARFSWDAGGRRNTEVVFTGDLAGSIRLDRDHCDYAWVQHADLAEGRFRCSPEVLSIAIALCRGKRNN